MIFADDESLYKIQDKTRIYQNKYVTLQTENQRTIMYQNWIKYNTKTASKSTQDCSPLFYYRSVNTTLTMQIPSGNAIANKN